MFNMGRSNAVNCGPYPEMRKVDDELPGYESATQQRSPRKSFILEHCVKCPVCEDIMHKEHLKGHLQRKHYAENNGVPIIYDGYHKFDICHNLMPKEHIQTHIERAHGNEMQNKDTFINCNLCEAYMHSIRLYARTFGAQTRET
ncbi:uncharacterized protein LOC116351850 [Contarinia nasturtii]|uniref:uncharacterized protein LOC116351850 n=1 Tax=Contarinia nasturtii TaxID=265458 RepID=UPI0012D45462|nr:uncharacterized protein LOC116351850 [Contarinia nasturtii]